MEVMQDNPSDRELVAAFLEAWEGVSGPEIERRVPGVTQSDVSRWRTGSWQRLTAPKARALREALARNDDEGRDDFTRGVRTALEKLEPALDAVRGLLPSQPPLRSGPPGSLLVEWAGELMEEHPENQVLAAVDHRARRLRRLGAMDDGDLRAWEGFLRGKGFDRESAPDVTLEDLGVEFQGPDEILDEAPELDLEALPEALMGFGEILEGGGHLEEAVRAYRLAYSGAAHQGDPNGAMEAARLAGRALRKRAEWDEALEWYGLAEDIAVAMGDNSHQALTLTGIANIHRERGNLPLARRVAEQQLVRASEEGNRTVVAYAHHQLLLVDMLAADYDGALEHAVKALRDCVPGVDQLRVVGDVGELALRRGDLDLARKALLLVADRALDLETTLPSLDALATVAGLTGDEERWAELTTRFESRASELPTHTWGEHLYHKGLSLEALGRRAEARRVLKDAIDFSEDHGLSRVLFDAEAALERLGHEREGLTTSPSTSKETKERLRDLRSILASL